MSRRGLKKSSWGFSLVLPILLLCPVLTALAEEKIVEVEKSAGSSEGASGETIKERYDNGRVKIQREVIQDDNDNYVNHGAWTMFDPRGRKIAEGRFQHGERQGLWTRWLFPGDSKMLTQNPYKEFPSPSFRKRSLKADGFRAPGLSSTRDSERSANGRIKTANATVPGLGSIPTGRNFAKRITKTEISSVRCGSGVTQDNCSAAKLSKKVVVLLHGSAITTNDAKSQKACISSPIVFLKPETTGGRLLCPK